MWVSFFCETRCRMCYSKCRWRQSNSVTETDVEHRPASVDIMSVKGYGPPSFFKDIARQPSNPVAAVRSKSVVRLANKQSSSQPAVTDGHAAIQPEIQTQKGINPAAAAAASKRFWAAAQTAKVPKHVSKKSAAASLFCTCSGAELRSEKCSFCLQFILE